MPPRGAACGGVPARAGTRPAAGTGDRDDHGPHWPSSTPSARPPTRWPAVSRRGVGRSPPPRRPHQPWPSRSARQHCGRVRQTGPPPQSRCPPAPPARAPATTARRRPPVLRGWSPRTVTVAECARIASTRSRRSVAHVLAVVEHQQPHPALQRGGHTLAHGLARLLGDAQHRGHRIGHRRRISDRGQLENPDPVGELIGQPRRNFGRQAGLADPAHPGQRHQPMSLDRRLHLGQLRTRARSSSSFEGAGFPVSHPAPAGAETRVRRPTARTWNISTGVGDVP